MAIPTLSALTTITDCDSITGWSGDTFVLEPDIKMQGTNSITCQMTANGANSATFTPAASINLTGQHIRAWYQSGLIAYVATVASNGVEFWISDGTYTHRWTIGGSDDWKAGWVNMVIYAESMPTSGYNASFNFAAVTSMGFTFNTVAKPRGVDNFWVDYLRYGDGYTVTGGTAFTTGNFINLDEIAKVDAANGYGIVVKSPENGAITLFGEVLIGNGATTTYYKENNATAIFADANVSSTLYKLAYQGSGCNVDLKALSLNAYLQTFLFDADDATLNSFVMDGCSITNASDVLLDAGCSVTNTVFSTCGQINPSTSTFENNTVANSVDTGGGILFVDSWGVTDCAFLNNLNAIEIDSASPTTKSFLDLTFDGNTYDVNNTSGTTLTVQKGGTSDPTTHTGSTVSFVASVTIAIHVQTVSNDNISGAYVYINDDDSGAAEINTQTDASGNVSDAYAGAATTSTLRVRKYGYKPFKDTVNLSQNIDRVITLIADPQQA
jgi:hypothetical protein